MALVQSWVRRFLVGLPWVAAMGMSACAGCVPSGGGVDAGPLFGLTYEDIGTPCVCDVVSSAEGPTCARNPTNTCAKSQLTCVMATPSPAFANAGHPLYEFHMFTGAVPVDGGIQLQGECTLVGNADAQLVCPSGTKAIQLSSGLKVCKRLCQSDGDCGRPGWVCDTPLLDRSGIDITPTPQELPLNVKLCKPGCVADFPDCLRTTACTLGRPGCYRSATAPSTAPPNLGIYVGDRNGARSCNTTTGACVPTNSRTPLALAGNACASNAGCPQLYLCVSDSWWSNHPVGSGFCTYADCDPAAASGQPGSCNPAQGLTCERAFEHGMCFLNCRGGTLCDFGQSCGTPEMNRILNQDPLGGGVITPWKQTQCIPCDLNSTCP